MILQNWVEQDWILNHKNQLQFIRRMKNHHVNPVNPVKKIVEIKTFLNPFANTECRF